MIISPKIAPEYSKIITYIKRDFLYQLNLNLKKRQKRFYEHTIRDEKDFLKIVDYMRINPVKHGLVTNTNNWKYS